MLKQLINEIMKILKNNYKFFIFLFIFLIINLIPLPFYIERNGGVVNLNDRVITDDNFEYKGSLNLSYVATLEGSIPGAIIALFNKNWDIESYEEENGNSTPKEAEFRNNITLLESISTAKITAFKYANKELEIKNRELYVTYVFDEAETDLKVGDIIKKINNCDINSKDDMSSCINDLNNGDTVNIEIINNNKQKTKKAKIIDLNGKKILGILCNTKYELEDDSKVKIKFEKDMAGSSGGLVLALSIYGKLVNDDITNGRKIAGTGTIDENGNVGEISGIKYKLAGAVKEKVELFLVPKENYKEAIKEKEKNNYDIKIYSVETFEDALNILKQKN